MRNTFFARRARLIAVPIVAGLAFAAFLVFGGSQPSGNTSALQSAALYSPGGGEPGEVSLTKVEQYWQTRLTYPTGRFDQRWALKAAKQAKRIKSGIPKGHYKAWRGSAARQFSGSHGAQSIKALSAARPLGPQPQASTGCQAPCFTFGLVSGRVNAIAFDPKNTSIAYLAQDGGGIWKTTNCCTPFTSWTVTTDAPNVPTTATDDVTVDPNNSNVVYAATGDLSFGSFAFGSAGVLKSTDAGATWQTLGANVFTPAYPAAAGGSYPQYQAVGKVRVDPNNSKKLVVGTKTGLYFSYDAGTNWTGPCLTNRFSTQRQDITGLILRDDGSTTSVYAAVGARGYGTFVQQNLGLNGANGIYRLGAIPASGCPAVGGWSALTSGWPVGTASGVACNPPPGDATTPCAPTANKVGRIELAIAPSDPQVLYAEVQKIDPQPNCGALQLVSATTARGCFLGLWRTSNGGTTWTQVADHSTMSFPEGTTSAGPCGEDTPQMWYDMALAVDPNNPDALFLDAIDIWKSTDGGKTLTDISCGYHVGLNPIGSPVHVDQHVLTYQPGSSSNLLAGSDGGVYVSNNAVNAPQGTLTGVVNPPTFKDVNLTMNTIEFYGGDISANFATAANPFIVAGAQDNGSSYGQFGPGATCPDTGCQWSQRIGGDGFYARIEPKQGRRVFMESQNGALQRSTTGPAGPYQSATGPWGGDRLSFIFPYEIDKFACPTTTCDHMIAGTNRVWESINGADSWYPNSSDLTKGTLGDRSFINQLSYAPTTNGNAIVGTNDGNVQYGFGLGTGTAEHGQLGQRDRRERRAAEPADPGRRDQSAERARRLCGRGRLQRKHQEDTGTRVPADVHDVLQLVHVDEQDRQPAEHPGELDRRESQRPQAGLRRDGLGPLLHGQHHRDHPGLDALPERPAQHDDLGHVDRPGRDDARALHPVTRRLGDSAADLVGEPGDVVLRRLRDGEGVDDVRRLRRLDEDERCSQPVDCVDVSALLGRL